MFAISKERILYSVNQAFWRQHTKVIMRFEDFSAEYGLGNMPVSYTYK